MQYINHWPDTTKLVLPKTVAQDLYRQLTEPFGNESLAKAFWEEVPSVIIILNPLDSIQQLKRGEMWQQIEFTLTYPEYITKLKMDYQLVLAIVNDSGSGIYLIKGCS